MFQKSLSMNICMLKLVGAWPRESLSKLGNFLYITFIVCFFLVPVSCFPLLYIIYTKENTDLIKISQTAFMSCELSLIAPKLILLLLDHTRLRTAVCYWDTRRFYSTPPCRSDEIIVETTEQTRKLCRLFTWLYALGAITWATKPFQNLSSRMLPANLWLPFDPFKNDIRYVLTYMHSFLACFLCAISNAAMDTILANLLLHAAGQIRILKEALMNMGTSANVQEELKMCVRHYAAIVKFVKLVEYIFGFAVFIQFFGSTVVICFSSFMMTVVPLISIEFLALLVYMLCIVGELFLLCYYGTVLYEESSNITASIYLGDWVDYNKTTKKGLLILMERTKRPLKIFAGGMIEISLLTFTRILRKAYSLFAVLKNMK